jgi:hypothetical protein
LLYVVSLVFWFVSGGDSDGSDGGCCGDVCSGGDGYCGDDGSDGGCCGDDSNGEQMRDLQQADQLQKALLMLL